MKPRLMHFVFACLSVLYFAPTSRSLAPELQVRHDALYRQIDVATSDQQLIEIFAALAQVNSEIATSFTDPKDVRRIVQHYNDAKYYFQQAARLERRSGSDDKSQDHLLLERRRRKFIEGNAAALASAVADDAFEIGEIVYSFTKRQSGAKSEKSQRVRLVKSKRKLADQVYVQLQSGKKVKQKVPYTWLRRKQRFTMTIPRMTTTELMNSPRFLTGHYPFIVTDVLNKWPAMQRWHSLDYLNSILPNEWVDFYPKNMYELGSKPWVMPSPQALDRFKSKLPHEDEFDSPRYLQYRLSLQGWRRLEQDLFEEGDVGYGDNSTFTGHRRRYLPSALWTEADWISCFGSDKNADNFYRTNQWNMLMIGEKGTGIFFHHDHLAAASWSAQVVGRKQWVVCPYNQSHLLSTDIFTFDADYESFPGFADAVCGETTVQAGELLYYPAYWWHQTKCLDRPTIGITGLMVGIEHNRGDVAARGTGNAEGKVHRQFLQDMLAKCDKCWPRDLSKCNGDFEACRKCEDISQKWPGAAPPVAHEMCAALPSCYELWDAHFRSVELEARNAAASRIHSSEEL